MSTMFASSRMRALIVPALTALAVAIALTGCEEDLKPKITKLTATPRCDVIRTVTEIKYDPNDSSIVEIDTLGAWLEVRFFGRATSGNEFSEPTGANSPLEWTWNFGDGGTASNVVGPVHRYMAPGEYTVTLTVKDDTGDEDAANVTVLVGQAYADLDIMQIAVKPDPYLTFRTVAGSTTVAQDRVFSQQRAVDRMRMSFDGTLESSCSVSGLFEEYLWEWNIEDVTTPHDTTLVDIDPAVITMDPGYIQMNAELSVTEAVTAINRIATASSFNPVGAKVGRPVDKWSVPNTDATFTLRGYLLRDVTEFTLEIEWPDSLGTLGAVDFDPAISSGFTATYQLVAPNLLGISLVNASGYAGAETSSKIADITLALTDVEAGPYAIRIRNPFAMRVGDPAEGAPFTKVDGGLELDTDCNGDGRSDSFDLLTNPGLFDCNRNGIHDSCDIANGTSLDLNGNEFPDECETP